MTKYSSKISFVLDGEIAEIDFSENKFLSPTMTVLNFLRSLPNHKGVKEGCAEGDCGACTVVLGELNEDGGVDYKAIDSCLVFLPMLQGKQLITIENLGTSANLHPVQKAMVDTDGSQCGYCTPGFIMSMFALYKNHNNPDRETIDDCLTGNLCRCTGYRPIVEAAEISCVHDGLDQFTDEESEIAPLLTAMKIASETLQLESNGQSYFVPNSIEAILQLRKEYPEALLVSGATDLALKVTKQKQLLKQLIDISQVEALRQYEETADDLVLGAGLSLEEVKALSSENFPALFDTLAVFGSLQIRNLATLGGNLGSASPIGDTPPILMAYDASVVLHGLDGERTLKLKDFITGYRQTELSNNEIISKIIIPKVKDGSFVKWYKISKRKDLDISTVSAGFRIKLSEDQTVEELELIYGGMAAMTKNADNTVQALVGKKWTRENVEEAMNFIDKDFTPISDARSSKEGRRVMARNLVLKFWADTAAVNV